MKREGEDKGWGLRTSRSWVGPERGLLGLGKKGEKKEKKRFESGGEKKLAAKPAFSKSGRSTSLRNATITSVSGRATIDSREKGSRKGKRGLTKVAQVELQRLACPLEGRAVPAPILMTRRFVPNDQKERVREKQKKQREKKKTFVEGAHCRNSLMGSISDHKNKIVSFGKKGEIGEGEIFPGT